MTCRETEKVLDLFLDGELEARTMRAVALHVTRCPLCEGLLRGLERLQELVSDSVSAGVGEVDFSQLWPSIESRADAVQRSWRRFGGRVRGLARRPAMIALGMAAALAVSVAALWQEVSWTWPAAPVNNQVRIDSLTGDAPSIAILSEPTSNTTVIWVAGEDATP